MYSPSSSPPAMPTCWPLSQYPPRTALASAPARPPPAAPPPPRRAPDPRARVPVARAAAPEPAWPEPPLPACPPVVSEPDDPQPNAKVAAADETTNHETNRLRVIACYL